MKQAREKIRVSRLRLLVSALILPLWLLPLPGMEVVDRVAAVVDTQVITLTDLLWAIRYRGLEIPDDPVARRDMLLESLTQLVEQKLIAREAAQTPGIQVTPQDIEARVTAYRSQFPSEEAFQQRLTQIEMTPSDLRELVARQLAVLQFVKVRFEPFIIVLPDQIEEYYSDELVPELRSGGQAPPPLEVVEEQIRQVLTLQRTNAEVENWVGNARRKADVEILLYRNPDWLPNLPAELASQLQITPVPETTAPSPPPTPHR